MKTIKLICAVLLVTCLFPMCKKGSKTDTKSNSEYYIKGTLAGKTINWQATNTDNGWAVGSRSVLPNDHGDISGGIAALFTNYPAGTQQFAIEFKTILKHIDDDATTVFNNFVKPGAWAYASDLNYTIGTKSVVIYYTDNNGNEYSSIGAQSNAVLNVISTTIVHGDEYNIYPGMRIKLSLSCKLYPANPGGDPINVTVTDGTVFLEDMYYLL